MKTSTLQQRFEEKFGRILENPEFNATEYILSFLLQEVEQAREEGRADLAAYKEWVEREVIGQRGAIIGGILGPENYQRGYTIGFQSGQEALRSSQRALLAVR